CRPIVQTGNLCRVHDVPCLLHSLLRTQYDESLSNTYNSLTAHLQQQMLHLNPPVARSACSSGRIQHQYISPPNRRAGDCPIPPLDKRSQKSFIRTNDRIRAREIRVIDENGEQLGVMAPFDALKIARERSLDLVEISPNAVPPVCKIQDYGKFLYEKDKSDRAARKKQKVIVIKEVKFSVTVDEHDYQTKNNQALRFLTEGDKVKASLRFKGRQMSHRDLG